jgi:hypothetical protein
LAYCDLETGAIIFYEKFEGHEETKDRYFVIISNKAALVECFTTTTQLHAKNSPKLANEYCEILEGECCLPKRCFVDFRSIYPFDDIQLGSRLRSKSVKRLGCLVPELLSRIRASLANSRSLSPDEKERLIAEIDKRIEG